MPIGVAQRRSRDREDRRRAIMNAAARLFMRAGYAAVNTNMIGDEAKVAVGTVYLYFRNKEDILLHILKEGSDRVYVVVRDAAASSADPMRSLATIGAAYAAYARENPEFFDVQQYFQHGALVRTLKPKTYAAWVPRIRRTARKTLALIEERIVAGQRTGQIDPGLEPRETAVLAWATMNGALQMASNPELREIAGLRAGDLIAAALRTILERMAPRSRGRAPRG